MLDQNDLNNIRNIGIIAHIDAGKTTTSERILYYTGSTYKLGNVDDGNTTTDFLPQERERGITIQSAVVTAFWKSFKINIIDTPGHVDFTAEVERALRVLDGGIIILSGVEGVQAQSETVWRQADKYHVPRIVYINKYDRVGVDFDKTVAAIREKLGARPGLVQLPVGKEDTFVGILDVMEAKKYLFTDPTGETYETVELDESEAAQVAQAREHLIEAVAEVDDEALEEYVATSTMEWGHVKPALRRATIANLMVPVFIGSSFRNKGIQPLLDGIVDYLPSPLDVKPAVGKIPGTDEKVDVMSDVNGPLVALVFKIVSDPYVGILSYVRIYSGVMRSSSYVVNANKGDKQRVSRLLRMHANKREDVEELGAGDLGAIVGSRDVITGTTLCDEEKLIQLETMHFPEPVVSVAVEPKTKADQQRLAASLAKFAIEDPTFRIKTDEETSETIISGMGELHLEIIIDRLLREYGVNATVGEPQVAYREAIGREVVQQGRYIKQTGGHGQYGDVVLRITPGERGTGIVFVNKTVGGSVPKQFVSSVEAGVREAVTSGPILGFPLVDVTVALTDGSYHPVDSSEMAFKIAASKALREGCTKASPFLLEPIMKLEIVVPKENIGDVIGSVTARRGTIQQIQDRGHLQVVESSAPLAAMFGYTTILRSLTQGRGSFSMEFSHYQKVSEDVREQVVTKFEGSSSKA
ncbi:elongation factor G [Candidatus Cryosericum terrychapinii]|jgi:elongation factor G|uniref:Elongation factor G n=1 Tax=Candidatus Cryosericum terrychapinii TaxID=2290919 RepID=A0A398D1V7_9BACT|nr:elongation factor G [Candidatus Cryosericum terrychapinii]RIE06147.1 elongation factor G [Candidatus Cryosericum terrychapinii]